MRYSLFYRLFAGGTAAFCLFAPAASFAQVAASADVGLQAQASTTARAQASTHVQASAKTRADTEIDARTQALQAMQTRVSSMKHLSSNDAQTLSNSVQAEIADLAALKAKIDADTDSATLKADLQSITKSYRIYALVMPQARIAAVADRVDTLVGMFTTEGQKISSRIAGDASLSVTLDEYTAKVADAQTSAQAALNATQSLTADNGDKTVFSSNVAALKSARSDLQTAQKDLVAARADLKALVQGIEASGTASASASTSASVQ